MSRDRRRYPRVAAELDLTFEAEGIRREAKTVNLGPYGAKVTLPSSSVVFPPGTRAELKLAIPDGEVVSLTAGVVRTDPDGVALNFTDPGALPFARLKDFVDSLLQRLPGDSVRSNPCAKMMKDRRRNLRVDAELDVTFEGEQPSGWRESQTMDLSPSGMKVALPSSSLQPPWGTRVKLRLAPPGGPPVISANGLVWRREPQSVALLLVNLDRDELERLKTLVNSLQTYRS